MNTMHSGKALGEVIPNIAAMLGQNAAKFSDKTVFQQENGEGFSAIRWSEFFRNIGFIAANLREHGFGPGEKMVIFSPNRLEMLEMELAVMASGGVAVPIFAFFKRDTAELLINHSDAKFMSIAGAYQFLNLSPDLPLRKIFVFDDIHDERFSNLVSFGDLLRENHTQAMNADCAPDDICLKMYTSGTMGVPKCVQLSHGNILSQRAALEKVWNIGAGDRFLSYLPWHHSFGGIFELFTALYHGATITLEPGFGKDPEKGMENWKLVKPTAFFSVPKVFEALVDLCRRSEETENAFFHDELKFVFTAAAPLPKKVSDEFEKRNIPVYEGWGLTETSPCCTLTDPKIKREQGVVGFPIPGVSIRLAEDGEIQVKGPHVMKGYYKNDTANKEAFTDDGWYRTGDVGEIGASGLKLISRKDRIFKLTNGEKVIPTEMESLIQSACHYVSYALVEGSGREYPVALLFPNKKLFEQPNYDSSPMEGCFCPRTIEELGRCLQGCLQEANCGIRQKFSRIRAAIIIDEELSIENNTLTPSMKIAPKNVLGIYKAHLENLYGDNNDKGLNEEVFVIQLENPVKVW